MSLSPTAHLLRQTSEGISLLGSQCNCCGEIYFPPTQACTACTQQDTSEVLLGGSGELWSWTLQSFLPKSPYNSGETLDSFKPYGVGYIQMPCGIKVESRLTCNNPEQMRIGMPMTLTLQTYGHSADGSALVSYAFAPADQENA